MTVAAGFAFDKGILFCADTRIDGPIQENESKLLVQIYGSSHECATIFAVAADDFMLGKAAVRDCEEAIEKINLKSATLTSIRNSIEHSLTKFYKAHIFPNPDRPSLWFLIGIWLRGEMRIYSTQETVLNRVMQYECVGSGGYLARYFIKQFLKSQEGDLTLEDAALVTSYAMKCAMEYDGYSGGQNAEFVILKENGEMGDHINTLIYPGEQFPEQIQLAMWPALRRLASLPDSQHMEMEADSILENFFEKVRGINTSYKWWFDLRANLINSIKP